MLDPRAGIRLSFVYYGWICLGAGLIVLAILGLLRLTGWLIDWQAPFDPADWFIFAGGLIVVLVTLGPYVVTVGQLAKVKRIRPTVINRQFAPSKRRNQITYAIIGGVAVVFAIILVVMQSFMVWFTFGSLFIIMALLLFYMAWRIGRYERAAKMIIQAQDYNWRFDSTSFVGVIKG